MQNTLWSIQEGILNVFASMPFSLTLLIVLTVLNMKFNKYVAIKSKSHSAELFKEKLIVESPISEFQIYSKFNELVEDKTSIFISHRMSSCRFCDDIIVFDSGEIIQRGNHDTLIKDENNVYGSLYNAQAKYYKRETA